MDMSEPYSGVDNLEAMREARRYNRFLHGLIEGRLRPSERVLDFGAGVGTFALPLMARGIDLVCVEPDAALAEALAAAGAAVSPDIAEVANASIDFLYSFNVIEHIADDRAALRQLARVVKPGGRFLIYVPAFQILFSSMDRKVGHLRRYRKGPLVRMLTEVGFTVTEGHYVDSLGFAATLLFRALGNDRGDLNPVGLRLYDGFVFPLSRVLDRLLGRWVGKNVLIAGVK